jgi:phosphatidylglycerophosphate synthase
LKYVPKSLVFLRASLGPVMLVGAWLQWPGWVFLAVLIVAILSDYFDGVIARRIGVADAWLRRADSLVDTIFFVFVLVATAVRFPQTGNLFSTGITTIAILVLLRLAVDMLKFRKPAAYHMWSAKLWGVTLLLGFSEIFMSASAGPLFTVAVGVGVFTNIEGLCASFVLPQWKHDVPTILHAVTIRKTFTDTNKE